MAAVVSDRLNLEDPVLRSFLVWSTILLLKTMAMSPLTSLNRFKYLIFASQEDTKIVKNSKVQYNQPDIERVRRAHRNDLENVFPFIIVGLFYTFSNPMEFIAVNLFRIAVISRIVHSFVYAIYVIPQPARGIAFAVPYAITVYMAIVTIIHFS